MNDRIRELYQQAHSIRHHDGDPMREGNPPTVYWQGEKSAEKFAELIVQECEKSIKSVPTHFEAQDKIIVECLKAISEHFFGVEE